MYGFQGFSIFRSKWDVKDKKSVVHRASARVTEGTYSICSCTEEVVGLGKDGNGLEGLSVKEY